MTLLASWRDHMDSTLQLLEIFVAQAEWWEITSLASLRAHKHAAVVAAFKVSLALDCAVVLACRLIKSDSDPDAYAGDLWNQSDV